MKLLLLTILACFSISMTTNTAMAKGTIAPEHQQCNDDSDCKMLMTRCDRCSCGEAVNKSQLFFYKKAMKEQCKYYQGQLCNLSCSAIVAQCVNNTCQVIGDELLQ